MSFQLAEDWQPKRIIQIISGSRSGSTLLKEVLSRSPSVCSLNGEEEVHFRATRNGYPWTANSECFHIGHHPTLLRRLIHTELSTDQPWIHRLPLQHSGDKLLELLDDLHQLEEGKPWDWLYKHGVAGYYDGCDKGDRLPVTKLHAEMAPFIIPTRRGVKDILLLKSPYKCYRLGLLEQVYNQAEFSYIILRRNPLATINGLVDGWRAPYGFLKHLIETEGGTVDWKFDLPPGWEAYLDAPDEEKAWFQWMKSYTFITRDRDLLNGNVVDVAFENLVNQPEFTTQSLCRKLEIEVPKAAPLPLKMATEPPKPKRWLDNPRRTYAILKLLERSKALVKELDYGDPSSWA